MCEVKADDIPSEQEVAPFFQPILSLQTRKIIAYEALGRRIREGKIQSLGPFFQNPRMGDDQHLRVDRLLRSKAMAKLVEAGGDTKLFINLKPSWIYKQFRESGELPTLRLIEQNGIDPSRIVIEITEEEFHGRLDELSAIIDIYKQAGCLIAIDDIGAGYSNYDRIASIKPHILKIDLKLLKKSTAHDGYKALLNSFSILASQMGASLLIEGVETRQDLNHSLKVGARYVQGFLFSEARAGLQPDSAFEKLLKEEIQLFTAEELARYRSLYAVQAGLQELVDADADVTTGTEADSLISGLIGSVADNVVRIYICCEDGRQVSSNFTRSEDGGWKTDLQFREANWIWRPYFIPNILQMSHHRQGILSQVYTDLDSSRPMQTYSCPVGERHYLFLDLMV